MLFVVSAGLGLVDQATPIPNYDLAASAVDNALPKTLRESGQTAEAWWSLIVAASPYSKSLTCLTTTNPAPLVLVALPASYLRLLHGELRAIVKSHRHRLRIFTSEAGRAELHREVARFALPYDDRLESIEGFSGTRADFPQRAMRHFVEALDPHVPDIEAAKEAVVRSLNGLRARTHPARQRLSNEEIAKELRINWQAYNGSSTKLLYYLRRQAGIACEQGRFREIWREVKAKQPRERAD